MEEAGGMARFSQADERVFLGVSIRFFLHFIVLGEFMLGISYLQWKGPVISGPPCPHLIFDSFLCSPSLSLALSHFFEWHHPPSPLLWAVRYRFESTFGRPGPVGFLSPYRAELALTTIGWSKEISWACKFHKCWYHKIHPLLMRVCIKNVLIRYGGHRNWIISRIDFLIIV